MCGCNQTVCQREREILMLAYNQQLLFRDEGVIVLGCPAKTQLEGTTTVFSVVE